MDWRVINDIRLGNHVCTNRGLCIVHLLLTIKQIIFLIATNYLKIRTSISYETRRLK